MACAAAVLLQIAAPTFAQAQTSNPADADRARICVYRPPAQWGRLVPLKVEANRVEIAKLRVREYSCTQLPPGPVILSGILWSDSRYSEDHRKELRRRLAGATTLHFKFAQLPGPVASFTFAEISAADAATEFRSYRRVEGTEFIGTRIDIDGIEPYDWLKQYHSDPKPAAVPSFLSASANEGFLRRPQYSALLVGFLSQIFRQNEPLIDRWLDDFDRFSGRERQVIACSLLVSGSPAGRTYLERSSGGPMTSERDRSTHCDSSQGLDLLTLKVESGTAINLLWGAFFATGNAEFIRRIASVLPQGASSRRELRLLAFTAELTLTTNARSHPAVMKACDDMASSSDTDIGGLMKRVVTNARKTRERPDNTIDPDARESGARGSL